MYDQLLAKDEFFTKMKAAGYTDEEVQENWQNLMNLFSMEIFKNAYSKLPKEKVAEIVGKEEINMNEAPEAFKKIGAYLQEHSQEYDFKSIILESAKTAIDKMQASINGGGKT